MGPLIPLFWASGDVCPRFQSQGGSLVCVLSCQHAMESSDWPLVQHLLTSGRTKMIFSWCVKILTSLSTDFSVSMIKFAHELHILYFWNDMETRRRKHLTSVCLCTAQGLQGSLLWSVSLTKPKNINLEEIRISGHVKWRPDYSGHKICNLETWL